jgi:heme/copper-type cytochrome/quinol oxidase subunit 1
MTRRRLPPPDATERARIRQVAFRYFIFFTLLFFLLEVAGRRGYLRRVPWLETGYAGPVTLSWAVTHFAIAVLIASLASFSFSRMLRFPKSGGSSDPHK